jgi:NADPH:quinone reductase-like Zn-dependent oxidoreductase
VEFVRSLGADDVWDYRTTRFEDVVPGVDVVFDAVGGETRDRSWSVLKPGGILVSIVAGPGEVERAAKAHGRRGVGFHMEPNREQLAEIAKLMESGAARAHIGATFPLSEARLAHERMEGGASTQGKIILAVPNKQGERQMTTIRFATIASALLLMLLQPTEL